MLILDEADHLLDLGFRKDLEKIVDCLPRQRQSLLFSATIPKEVRFFLISLLTGQTSSTIVSHDFILILIMLMQVHRISQLVLKREHDFVNTVGCMETPAKVYLKSRNCYGKITNQGMTDDDYLMLLQIIMLPIKQCPQLQIIILPIKQCPQFVLG